MKTEIRHGKNPIEWLTDVTKKMCRKHFVEYNELGWLSKQDNITIVTQSECECFACKVK